MERTFKEVVEPFDVVIYDTDTSRGVEPTPVSKGAYAPDIIILSRAPGRV